mgnify:CR=1 FL=1
MLSAEGLCLLSKMFEPQHLMCQWGNPFSAQRVICKSLSSTCNAGKMDQTWSNKYTRLPAQ